MSVHLAWASSEAKLASIRSKSSSSTSRKVPGPFRRPEREGPHALVSAHIQAHRDLDPKTATARLQDLLSATRSGVTSAPPGVCQASAYLRRHPLAEGERDPRGSKSESSPATGASSVRLLDRLERDLAVRMGRWQPVDRESSPPTAAPRRGGARPAPEPVDRPRSVGFQISSLYSHFVSLSAIAASSFGRSSPEPRARGCRISTTTSSASLRRPRPDRAAPVESLLRFRDASSRP